MIDGRFHPFCWRRSLAAAHTRRPARSDWLGPRLFYHRINGDQRLRTLGLNVRPLFRGLSDSAFSWELNE